MDDPSAIDIRYLRGVGPQRARLFSSLGIHSVIDILYYFPRRYEDRTGIVEIAKLKAGEYQTVKARILGFGERQSFRRRNFKLSEATVEDATGRLSCLWFNQPYLKGYLKPGADVVLYGRLEFYGGSPQMQNPEYEIAGADDKESLNYGRIVPIYSLPEKISQRMFRRIVKSGLDEYLPACLDCLPYDVRKRHKLFNIAGAILNMHFPQDASAQESAFRRILFEECFLLQALFGIGRLKENKLAGIAHNFDEDFLLEFEKVLPFRLSPSQIKVIRQIRKDMASSHPMRRLLQGDVGTGKTIVALYGCMAAVSSGRQAVLMAPTEILARQHYECAARYAPRVRSHNKQIKVALLTSGLNKKEKEKIYSDIKNGNIDILIGTHALIQEGLEFKALSFVVIDEQHKFGVHQRIGILAKGLNPDCLIMTATPIPRTLAMTLYADLEISTIDAFTQARPPVRTYLINENRRQWAYELVRENLSAGRQAYIVYPIIDESESLDLKSASAMYEDLRKGAFAEFRVGLIHGRLKGDKRNVIMREFKEGTVDVLVSTVVIEVGIDIPNVSVMMIEHAERFGLSQLHQLRGRIGRGKYESHCILVSSAQGEYAGKRLNAILTESDGFKIAEEDLKIRGPGEFFGARQHGLPQMLVNPLQDLESLRIAKEEAERILENDPLLSLRQNAVLAKTLKNRFPGHEALTRAG